MTSHRIGVNLRVSGNCDQGGRKYMEDTHSIKFVKKDTRDYEFAYFGIFDGHGGPEASRFARDNLLNEITKYDQFWSDNDDDVLYAVKSGFLDTHHAMWKELDNWPLTVSGLPSTSGTTASIAIVKQGKLYIGHVGDSGIVMGCDEGPKNAVYMRPKCLTKDHKPDNPEEKARIERSGGSVVAKAGVQRVVWSRPKVNHKGPVRRSTQIDKIPFLAVARSLGDLWSYDYYKGQFVVSPEPDVSVMTLIPGKHRCLVLASDGMWNMLSPAEAVSVVTDLEMHFEDRVIHDPMASVSYWINPAERLVTRALNKWQAKNMKADNISCIVVLIDPLGPSKLTILRKRREEHFRKLREAKMKAVATKTNTTPSSDLSGGSSASSEESVETSDNSSSVSSSAVTSASSKLSTDGNSVDGPKHQSSNDQKNLGGSASGSNKNQSNVCGHRNPANTGHKNQSNNGSHMHREDKEDADENDAKRSTETDKKRQASAFGFGLSSSMGLATSDSNHNVNNGSGHSVDDSMVHYDGRARAPARPASTSRLGRTHRPSLYRTSTSRLSLPPRSLVTNEMDDSVQATSALNPSPTFNLPLSPMLESPLFPNPEPSLEGSGLGKEGSGLGNPRSAFTPDSSLSSSFSMSDSLRKLMSLDAVKASSDPIMRPQAHRHSVGKPPSEGHPVMKPTSLAQSVVKQSSQVHTVKSSSQGQSVVKPSSQGHSVVKQPPQGHAVTLSAANCMSKKSSTPVDSTEPQRKLRHSSMLSHSVLHTSLQQPSEPSTMNTSSSTDRLSLRLNKTFHSTRVLRVTTTQKGSKESAEQSSLEADKSLDDSKPTKTPLTARESASAKKARKKREFGLLYRTRSTLLRAKRAARKAFCPENRPMMKHLPGAKRKREEKNQPSGTPSKRLRRSDGLRYSL